MSQNGDRGQGSGSHSGGDRRIAQPLQFARQVRRLPPCAAYNSGDSTPTLVQPQHVFEWKAGKASVANDSREVYRERCPEQPSSGTATPLTACISSPTNRRRGSTRSSCSVPIQEENGRAGSNVNYHQYPEYVNLPYVHPEREYVNLPYVHVEDDSSPDSTNGTAASGHSMCQLGPPCDFVFDIHGKSYFGGTPNESDSGAPDSDAEIPRPMKLAVIRPEACEVGISSLIAISLSDENGICLQEPECIVQYWKHGGKQLEFVRSGRRGMNKYEVETYTPCFETAGERIVQIITQDRMRIIAIAKFSVTARIPPNVYNIIIQSPTSGMVEQVVNITSNQVKPSDENEGSFTCGRLHCVGGGQYQSAEFVHGLLDFALNAERGGLPPSVSLRHLLASLPNLREILQTYHRAAGSLRHFVDVVRQQCTQEAVVRDIEFLVDQCNHVTDSDSQYQSQTTLSVETESRCINSNPIVSETYDSAPEQLESDCPIYDEVLKSEEQSDVTRVSHEYTLPLENIQPQENGLQWPSKLYHMSEKRRVSLLTEVRDKTLSLNRAIEDARDYVYVTRPMSAPTSPILAKKTKKERTKSSRQHMGALELFKKTTSLITSNKSISDSQSGRSTDDSDLKVQSRHRKGKKIRSEEEQQEIRKKLSASSRDTLTSSSSTTTADIDSLASKSSNEQNVESLKKQTDMESTMINNVSPCSGADVSHGANIQWGGCVAELKGKMKDKSYFADDN